MQSLSGQAVIQGDDRRASTGGGEPGQHRLPRSGTS